MDGGGSAVALARGVAWRPQTPQPLSRIPGMDPRTLAISMDAFHAQLFTLTYESFLPHGVVSSRLGRLAAQHAVKLFVASYQYVRARRSSGRPGAAAVHRLTAAAPWLPRTKPEGGCDRHRRLSDTLFDPKNKYEFPSTLIIRTPSEVGTLLGAPAMEASDVGSVPAADRGSAAATAALAADADLARVPTLLPAPGSTMWTSPVDVGFGPQTIPPPV